MLRRYRWIRATRPMTVLDFAPILAAAFALPQFLPQIHRVWRGDARGVSWSWAALASINNASWFTYFALSAYWTALVPVGSSAVLAGTLAVLLAWRRRPAARQVGGVATWLTIVVVSLALGGILGLGTLLAAAFLVQMAPSLWTAYRTHDPSGISRGTWLLVLGEVSCWLAYGLHQADARLIVLGVSGIVCSGLMLARTVRSSRLEPVTSVAD